MGEWFEPILDEGEECDFQKYEREGYETYFTKDNQTFKNGLFWEDFEMHLGNDFKNVLGAIVRSYSHKEIIEGNEVYFYKA